MSFPTKNSFTFDFTAQSDYPAWTPLQTKQNLNARSEELRLALNSAITLLNSTTAGATGANNIGATAPTGLTGTNIQAILNALKIAIDGVAIGSIPDGSLTDAKFSSANLKTTPYALTTNAGNAYSVTVTGATLVDGLPLCVKFNAASTGAITVNLNSLGAISVVDYFGQAVTNVRLNLIANLRYDAVNGNFQLQGKGGGGNATAAQLLSGATATADTGQITGTMPENGALNFTPSASTQTGPAGHTTGVTVAAVTFNAAKVLNDTTIAGTAGTMTSNASPTATITTQGGSVVVLAGYNPGGTITASLSVSAGNSVIAEDATLHEVTQSVYTKTGYRYTMQYGGTIRISISIKSNSGNSTSAYGKIYKNGVAVGTERTAVSTGYTVFTEDFSCNVGDYFEVWGYGIASNSYFDVNDTKIMIATTSMVTMA